MSCSSLNKFRLVWIYINRPNNLRWILYEKSNYSYRSLFCKMFVPLKSSFRKKEQHYSTKLPCFFIWSVVNTPYFVYLIKNICNTPHTYAHLQTHTRIAKDYFYKTQAQQVWVSSYIARFLPLPQLSGGRWTQVNVGIWKCQQHLPLCPLPTSLSHALHYCCVIAKCKILHKSSQVQSISSMGGESKDNNKCVYWLYYKIYSTYWVPNLSLVTWCSNLIE